MRPLSSHEPLTSVGRARASGRRAGLTLIELLISITVLLIGVGVVVSGLIASRNLSRTNREVTAAAAAAESVLERLRATEFRQVFAVFNDDPADDPAGVEIHGSGFDVPLLRAQDGDADGLAGEVLFPTLGGALREDLNDAFLGLPRDLDFDGDVDAADHAEDYQVLPVRIRIAWTGQSGDQVIELPLLLADND